MMPSQQILTQKEREGYARLTAPQHIVTGYFKEHRKIEGYFEDRDVPEFIGSDRLLRHDTIYGTIQMGYEPRRGQSFLFANIKTSLWDTAPSRHQRELREYQMKRALKTGTQNLAYTANRRGGSAVILYKTQNGPWSPASIAPYLHKANLEALRKTMPFLDQSGEREYLEEARQQHKELGRKLTAQLARKDYAAMADIRAQQLATSARHDEFNALLYRGDTQRRLFFRRLNYAMDIQKIEMFAYYRNRKPDDKDVREEAAPAAPNKEEQDE